MKRLLLIFVLALLALIFLNGSVSAYYDFYSSGYSYAGHLSGSYEVIPIYYSSHGRNTYAYKERLVLPSKRYYASDRFFIKYNSFKPYYYRQIDYQDGYYSSFYPDVLDNYHPSAYYYNPRY